MTDAVSPLAHDAETGPLLRVTFQPGMLLGVEAMQAEQAYHRRRLNRHGRLLHGYGTLYGLLVTLEPAAAVLPLRLVVHPGLALDALGRELLLSEPYGVDLPAWLAEQGAAALAAFAVPADAAEGAPRTLTLEVAVRYADCEQGLQPVLAAATNASTDAVAASRAGEAVELLLRGADPNPPPPPAPPASLPTAVEQARLDNADAATRTVLQAQLDRLHRTRGLDALPALGADSAELTLARLTLRLTTLTAPQPAPADIDLDNLVRPFLDVAVEP